MKQRISIAGRPAATAFHVGDQRLNERIIERTVLVWSALAKRNELRDGDGRHEGTLVEWERNGSDTKTIRDSETGIWATFEVTAT